MIFSIDATIVWFTVVAAMASSTAAFVVPSVLTPKEQVASSSIFASVFNAENSHQDDEWHPMDPANTTPQLMSALWFLISNASSLVRGESTTIVFPKMQDQFSPSYLSRLLAHFDSCKDVCDTFGSKTVLVPYINKIGQPLGFTVKSFRNPDKDQEDEFEFDYDPFWDDGNEFDYEGIDDEYEDAETKKKYPDIVNRIPDDDDEIISTTKVWVDKLMSNMGICPFTSGPDLSGMPLGKVYYCVDRSTQVEDVYCKYWNEVVRVEQVPEKDLSTTLLILPEFCMDNAELFENFATTLTQPLEALGVEDLLQLIFFHPEYSFRDGGERSGVGAAANYARRSPWPMINILRTNQVRAAQKGIPTGLVYKQNEKTLSQIGTDKLETMLRLRNWDEIKDVKVNRRDMEALRIAMDMKETGQVAPEDSDVVHDVTPAANKVGEEQTKGSNMANVVLQALEKRLGVNGAAVRPLSGPETSATIMASDFLLKSLNDVAQGKQVNSPPPPPEPAVSKVVPEEMVVDDSDSYAEEDEVSVLFGGAGIMGNSDDDEEDLNLGSDPFGWAKDF